MGELAGREAPRGGLGRTPRSGSAEPGSGCEVVEPRQTSCCSTGLQGPRHPAAGGPLAVPAERGPGRGARTARGRPAGPAAMPAAGARGSRLCLFGT